jgi:TPR repeat protein
MYYNGWGTKQNYKKALNSFLEPAKNGSSEAQTMLANIYARGLGVEQDAVEAHNWLRLVKDKKGTKSKLTI